MPDEWLTYSEIGARLGLNAEAARTRARRAGWRTQPGNDGRTRVLVPDRALQHPVDKPGQDRANETDRLTGLVELLTAAEARVSRLEQQLEAERARADEARTEAGQLRAELMVTQSDLSARTVQVDETRSERDQARAEAQKAEQTVEELRRADEARSARGRWARLRAAWRGE
jgi:septal ring factor EnvC (AmiA/AmiB activator)